MTLELKEVSASNERLKVEPLLYHSPGVAVLFHLGEHVEFGGLLLKNSSYYRFLQHHLRF